MFHLPSASWFTPDLKQIWEGFPYLIIWVEVVEGSGTWPKQNEMVQNNAKQAVLSSQKLVLGTNLCGHHVEPAYSETQDGQLEPCHPVNTPQVF